MSEGAVQKPKTIHFMIFKPHIWWEPANIWHCRLINGSNDPPVIKIVADWLSAIRHLPDSSIKSTQNDFSVSDFVWSNLPLKLPEVWNNSSPKKCRELEIQRTGTETLKWEMLFLLAGIFLLTVSEITTVSVSQFLFGGFWQWWRSGKKRMRLLSNCNCSVSQSGHLSFQEGEDLQTRLLFDSDVNVIFFIESK